MSMYLTYPSIARNGTIAAIALITLSLGVFFNIKAGSNNNVIVQQWSTQDGRQVSYMTSSGALTMSGALRTRSTMSGSTLTLFGYPPGAIGQATCFKPGGVIGYCSTTPTNGTCTCN